MHKSHLLQQHSREQLTVGLYSRPYYVQKVQKVLDQHDIHILSGLRRIGKKSIMMSFYDDTSCIIDCSKLDRQISHDYDALKSYCTPQTPTTYFFYEIQEIPQHIRLLEYIRRLPTTITVFVSTHRHSMIDGYTHHIQPMTYDEYTGSDYMISGLPEACTLHAKGYDILPYYFQSLTHTILIQDIIKPLGIKDVQLLLALFELCLTLVSRCITINSLTTRLQHQGYTTNRNTIKSYLYALHDADLVRIIYAKNYIMIYPIDHGFLRHYHDILVPDSHVISTIFATWLTVHGYDVRSIKLGDMLIDFVVGDVYFSAIRQSGCHYLGDIWRDTNHLTYIIQNHISCK